MRPIPSPSSDPSSWPGAIIWLTPRYFAAQQYGKAPRGTSRETDCLEVANRAAALQSAGFSPGPIELQSWGDRDFRLRDRDGYYVRVSEGSAVPPGP